MTDIEDSVVLDGLQIGYLKLFGLWKVIKDFRGTGKRNWVIRYQLVVTLLICMPYILCQYFSYFCIRVDIQKATFLNLQSLPAVQMCCKVLVFWFRLDSMSRLFDLLRKDFLQSLPNRKRAAASKIFATTARRANRFCTATLSINTSVVVLSILDPGISVEYIAYHTGNMASVSGGRKKILGGWYPLPLADYPYFEAIFCYEAFLIIWGGILLAVYACLFYQVLACLNAQFQVLNHHVSTLTVESTDSPLYSELYAIIKDHQVLISYANELRSVYNPLVTMILGMGIFVLIIAVFQFLFGNTASPMMVFKSLQFLAYQGIEVSMFCFGSSSVQESSSELLMSIYRSDWYRSDVQYRRAALMVMARANRPMTLTAIRMYPVNLETMMNIFQFSYTVSTLMSRMTE